MYQGKKVACLLMAAGQGTRMGKGRAKQFREVGGRSVIERTLLAFAHNPFVDDILIVTGEDDRMFCNTLGLTKGNGKMKAVCLGGETREDSVWNGLKVLAALRGDEPDGVNEAADDIVLIQDAARPFTTADVIDRVTEAAYRFGAAVPCIPARDTIKIAEGDYVSETLPREKLFGAQTPQGFRRGLLAAAMRKGRRKGFAATDDASYVEKYGGNVRIVPGDIRNIKITTIEDMATAEMLAAAADEGFRPTASYFLTGKAMPEKRSEEPARMERSTPETRPESGTVSRTESPGTARKEAAAPPEKAEAVPRIGEGYDVHMLVPGRPLVLGGVTVPFAKGLEGHSDADVMTHAAMDALLGAASLGDIGHLFPDRDPAYEGVYSLALLEVVRRLLERRGFVIGNLDVTLQAQEPKIAPFIPAMRANYAKILRIPERRISVKATTTERLGFVGHGEGMAASAVCLLFELPPADGENAYSAEKERPEENAVPAADSVPERKSVPGGCAVSDEKTASGPEPGAGTEPADTGWIRLTFE